MKRKRFNEKGEELQSLSIDLAKKILRDQKEHSNSVSREASKNLKSSTNNFQITILKT